MEIKTNVNGTVLLLVLMVITFVIVVATTALRSGTLLYELALDRVEQATQFHAMKALAYYGIACCKNSLEKKDNELTNPLTFDHWPLPHGAYQGSITITESKDAYTIKAILSKQGDQLCTVLCNIGLFQHDWHITNWAYA